MRNNFFIPHILLILVTALTGLNDVYQEQHTVLVAPLALKGYIRRTFPIIDQQSGYSLQTQPEADARVSLCDANLQCDVTLDTVSDSEGFFLIVLPPLPAKKDFTLLIRPIGGAQKTIQLGTIEEIESIRDPLSIELRGSVNRRLDEHILALNKHPELAKMDVLFATDRAVLSDMSTVKILNSHASDGNLTYGRCETAIQTNGIYDRVIDYISAAGRNHGYFSVQKLVMLEKRVMWKDLIHRLQADSSHDALLFIHGYDTSFDDACRRTAQIAYDLKFGGAVLLYSWPSHDSWPAYAADEEMTEWTDKHFRMFLNDVLGTAGLNHLHIIAHSMGNRVLMRALLSGTIKDKEQTHLGQIILAAPDVNRVISDEWSLDKIKKQRITLYASNHDQALLASGLFHRYSRLGDSRPDIYVRVGMDSIDASDVDTSLLGHSYVSTSGPVLADISVLVASNRAPVRRLGLIKEGKAPKEWWYMNPSDRLMAGRFP